ncbi:MAG: GEVED domain-containing protein [Chitinophagales bacterium]
MNAVFIVNAQYCIPDYTVGTTDDDYIDGFELGTISNLATGGGDGSGYTDFTALSTYLNISDTYSIHVVNTPSFSESYRCWIDYNQDLEFTDDEELFESFTLGLAGETTEDFTVPLTAAPGFTTLRIRCVFATADFDACGTETYGEAEDYSVFIGGFTHDLSVFSIVEIPAACELSSAETVSVIIRNYGTEDESSFDVKFSVDGGTFVSEPFIGTIVAGGTYLYTFSSGADVSADGFHTLAAWTSFAVDEFPGNDTSTIIVENTFTYLTTGFPLNICYSGDNIFPSPIAAGGTWSGDGIINALTGELDPSLVGGIGSSTDITYSFSPIAEYTVSEIPFAPYTLLLPTELTLGDDDFEDDIDIGFDFTYFGEHYDKLFISSNGLLGFGVATNTYNNQHLPDPAIPNNIISFCWTDLNPGAGGDMRYEIQGSAPFRRFVLELDEVPHYLAPETVSLQVVLYETSNAIDIHAVDIQSDGGEVTQGIENQTGTVAYFADEAYNKAPFSMTEIAWRYAVTPCDATVTETISFIEPPVVELDSAEVCTGTIVTLDAGAGAEAYIWSTGESTQTIDVATSGTYWVIYFANVTCYVDDSTNIIVNPVPPIDLGIGGAICEGTMLDAGNPGSVYDWNTGAVSQTIFVTESGSYSVEVTTAIGCENSDSVDVTIIPLPVASFDAVAGGALTLLFTNTSVGAFTWYWDFGDGTFSFEENPWHTYPYADSWNVTLVITNDCGADIASAAYQVMTGINELENEVQSVYPNPASGQINIHFNNAISFGTEIYVYDMQGKIISRSMVNSTSINNFTLSTSEFSPGEFMIVIKGSDGIISIPVTIIK